MRKAMLFLLTLLTLPAYAFELKPFTASYTADWKQMPISGNASRSLKALGDGRWQLDFEASMLLASLNEVSTFKVENDTFLPQTYRFARQGLGKGKQIELDFDWSQKQVLGSDRGDAVRQPLNRGQLDKSTYQLVLQHDVADGKEEHELPDHRGRGCRYLRLPGSRRGKGTHPGWPDQRDQGRARA